MFVKTFSFYLHQRFIAISLNSGFDSDRES